MLLHPAPLHRLFAVMGINLAFDGIDLSGKSAEQIREGISKEQL